MTSTNKATLLVKRLILGLDAKEERRYQILKAELAVVGPKDHQ